MKLACIKPRLNTASTTRLRGLVVNEKPDDRRGTAHQRGYGWKWQKAREGWLRAHPLCEYCKREGRVTEATLVDHIIPHRGDMKLFWDAENNWQSLCTPCHSSTKQAEENAAC